jgi:putative FmdB family regulatory protein
MDKTSLNTLYIPLYTFFMPTFDFHCTACNKVFEEMLPFGSKGKPVCPSCGSKQTEKMISMPSIAFKGSGFYKTDSKSKTATPVKTEKKEEVPATTTPNEKKQEASKESKATTKP